MSLDENIGQLLNRIDELQLSDNTLIVFMSDNGGAEYTFATDNGDYKGGKITDLEGGVRVPLFLRWPANIPSGISYEKPVLSMDVFSTIVNVTGSSLPNDRIYDGVNLMPFIHHVENESPHQYMYWKRGIAQTIRSDQYKLFLNDELGDTLLFDLQADPIEQYNIYHENKAIAKQLAKALNDWSATLPEPLWPSVIYYDFKEGDNHFLFDQ